MDNRGYVLQSLVLKDFLPRAVVNISVPEPRPDNPAKSPKNACFTVHATPSWKLVPFTTRVSVPSEWLSKLGNVHLASL